MSFFDRNRHRIAAGVLLAAIATVFGQHFALWVAIAFLAFMLTNRAAALVEGFGAVLALTVISAVIGLLGFGALFAKLGWQAGLADLGLILTWYGLYKDRPDPVQQARRRAAGGRP